MALASTKIMYLLPLLKHFRCYVFTEKVPVQSKGQENIFLIHTPRQKFSIHVGQLVPAINLSDLGVEEIFCIAFNGNG